MYKNTNVINKILLSASIICLCIAIYLVAAFALGEFVKCLPLLATPVFLCVLVAVYTPPVKTRTAMVVSAFCATAAVALIVTVAVEFLPA